MYRDCKDPYLIVRFSYSIYDFLSSTVSTYGRTESATITAPLSSFHGSMHAFLSSTISTYGCTESATIIPISSRKHRAHTDVPERSPHNINQPCQAAFHLPALRHSLANRKPTRMAPCSDHTSIYSNRIKVCRYQEAASL